MSDSMYNRRSIRKYLDKNVPKEMIEQVVDAGRVAPSAKNRQPWKYIVLGGEAKVEFLEHMKMEFQEKKTNVQRCPIPEAGFLMQRIHGRLWCSIDWRSKK